jgi:3-phosphoshikimate 1-carboxyvinyltransferase
MNMMFKGGKLNGTISTPPSKSHTHRAFFLAAMADGKSEINNVLLSEDTKATLRSCEAMGAKIKIEIEKEDVNGKRVIIEGGNLHAPIDTVDTANSGTTMRLLTGIVSIFDKKVTITGDESLKKRPMAPLLDALRMTGVTCTSENGRPPVTVKGPNTGGHVEIDGTVSSQFITSLLITAPMLPDDTQLTVNGQILSDPYLDITQNMMRIAGAQSTREKNHFQVKGKSGYKAFNYHVPADFSSAAFPLVGAALNGENVTVTDMDLSDPQGDRRILDILRLCGATVNVSGKNISVSKSRLKAVDIDMGNTPDLFPVVAVLLSTADGTSRLFGAPQLRHKESDRIKSTVAMLKAIGADAEETADGCIIHGKKRLTGGTVQTLDDHRILMSAAIASLVCENPVIVDNDDCYAVSYPNFPEDMSKIGLIFER